MLQQYLMKFAATVIFIGVLCTDNSVLAKEKVTTHNSKQTSSTPTSHHGPLGIGLALGSPTAITGEYWLDRQNSVDFGIGFGWAPWTLVYADYHWNFPQIFGRDSQFARQTIGYFGVGAGLGFWSSRDKCGRFSCGNNSTGMAVVLRVPVGLEWFPHRPPFGVFAELAPDFAVIPGFGGSVDFQIGARYYF